jgi:NAD(P)-dependent dehydrogenase (short-subunit alcohol dehydrogenase family)
MSAVMEGSMRGKTVLVTGASSGIGRATALALAGQGARLLLAGRTPERCEEALASVRAAGAEDAQMLLADLSSLAGIRKLADDVKTHTDRLDVLVNNAGTTLARRSTTADGYETTFAVNHLGYFLLTGLLLPLVRAAAPARIVSVASDAHRFGGRLDLEDLQSQRSYGALRVYGKSKTANILWNCELARRLEGTGVTANCLHPGGVRTNLGRGNGLLLDALQRFAGLFMRSAEQGAATSIYLATSPEVADVSGRYFANSKQRRPAAYATDRASSERLWAISEEMAGIRYP